MEFFTVNYFRSSLWVNVFFFCYSSGGSPSLDGLSSWKRKSEGGYLMIEIKKSEDTHHF